MPSDVSSLRCTLAPWITIPGGGNAIAFYKSAFGAQEVYRNDDPSGGVVVRLSVNGAEFWVSEEAPGDAQSISEPIGGGSVRMILSVPNPDAVFARVLKAGATEVFPVGKDHGWRLGRLEDPFGLHWEIGHPLAH
jgi:PhnB protein